MATVAEALDKTRRDFAAAGLSTPDLDARLLLCAATGLDRAGLVLKAREPMGAPALSAFEAMSARRLRGEPVHRILGRRAFYDHDFLLSRDTLEPRPDTEILVDLARRFLAGRAESGTGCRFVDVGTGTGAIAVSLLAALPLAECVAIDLAPGALVTARANAVLAGVERRFFPVASDYLSALGGSFDAIVANPPYIPSGEIADLERDVREHDPLLALDGGADGLTAYRALAQQSRRILAAQGAVLVEIGFGQAPDVRMIFEAGGFVLTGEALDLGDRVRALEFRRSDLADTPSVESV
ncbi:peptide chain release factor N(5)-glutamine methyltransferase [Consotaella salsifontis]|uniref:Release factor glutamine methyltransferase n=1 Tax=Consotaella salsifontis TaxID=1365950 RepID=A0A1T4QLG1_9HYPH|nr:peptide chain release factor N(5)-glutamine methyltransferase [Consotaella salsifontis]SKA04467.1 release factor glutamine methyltransferase [Consotaella salsifontis]